MTVEGDPGTDVCAGVRAGSGVGRHLLRRRPRLGDLCDLALDVADTHLLCLPFGERSSRSGRVTAPVPSPGCDTSPDGAPSHPGSRANGPDVRDGRPGVAGPTRDRDRCITPPVGPVGPGRRPPSGPSLLRKSSIWGMRKTAGRRILPGDPSPYRRCGTAGRVQGVPRGDTVRFRCHRGLGGLLRALFGPLPRPRLGRAATG